MASDDGPTKTKRLYQVWKGSNDLGFLFFTSGRDPGTLPRNSTPPPPDSDEAFEETTPSMEWVNGRTPHLKLPRTKDVMVNGHTVKVNVTIGSSLCLYQPQPSCAYMSLFVLGSLSLKRELTSDNESNIWKALSHDILSVILIVYCFIAVCSSVVLQFSISISFAVIKLHTRTSAIDMIKRKTLITKEQLEIFEKCFSPRFLLH
ncbi:hypothetical protein V6N11_079537 [Hibiscus sabdariffa]|uniref:Uncharacterized protein n=1 Tax=Hibiscus sabdariffa TaxID=183260 RepID=A0ABR2RVP5_9ROSI